MFFFNEFRVKMQFLFQKDTESWCIILFGCISMAADQTWGLFFSDLLLAEKACAVPRAALRLCMELSKLSDPWNERCCSTKQCEFLRWITLSPRHALLLYESHATARLYICVTVVSTPPSLQFPPSHRCFGAPTLPCFIVTVERVTPTFSILLCVLCLLLSSFTSAIKLYYSRQELFTTSVWRQFDKAWVNTDLAKYPTKILSDCFTGFQIGLILSKQDVFHRLIGSNCQ